MENKFVDTKKKGRTKNIIDIVVLAIIILALILNFKDLSRFLASVGNIFVKYKRYFLVGIGITLALSVISVILGSLLGTLIYFLRISKSKVLSKLAVAVVEILRGTPLLVQIFIVFFGIGGAIDMRTSGISLSQLAFVSGIIAVSINSGAYVSEIIRSGFQSVPKGQMEAGRSLGMSYSMTMKEIIMPQAIKNILPALGNELVTLIKETSIASTIGVTEIMYNTGIVRSKSFIPMEPLIVAAIMYFIVTFTLSKILASFERRLKESD